MDIKAKIDELVDKIKSDKQLGAKFQKDPVSTVEELIGVDLPNDQVEKVVDYAIPGTDVSHRLIFIKKVQKSDKKYPRTFAKIKKNPL